MNTDGCGLGGVKSRWGGTYNGAGECSEGDISKEENKGQKGLTSVGNRAAGAWICVVTCGGGGWEHTIVVVMVCHYLW